MLSALRRNNRMKEKGNPLPGLLSVYYDLHGLASAVNQSYGLTAKFHVINRSANDFLKQLQPFAWTAR